MTGILAYWFALLVWWLIENFSVSLVDVKAFMNGLPVGFWTVLGSLITATVAMLTLVVTQVVNLHSQDRQAKIQNKALTTQLNHQRELAYRQHFLDKRTDALLDFQKELEECMEILEYFYSESADLDRRRKLHVTYSTSVIKLPLLKEDIIEDFTLNDIVDMVNCALKQIMPLEERSVALKKSFKLFEIYLDSDERIQVAGTVKRINYLQDYLISNLKRLKTKPDPKDLSFLMFVHMIEDLDESFEMRKISQRIHSVRDVFKKYLYIHKLDA
ncbi:hypothetical protein V7247_25850 [Priestia megaterium]|uniref:hypothetical protein n=1 Tax=Priestia megaterium TaxID=1404 RepID=UPI002FFDF52B